MKKKIPPQWILEEINNISKIGVDIFDISVVKKYFISHGNPRMVEWLSDNRESYTYCILSKQYEDPSFYYEGF